MRLLFSPTPSPTNEGEAIEGTQATDVGKRSKAVAGNKATDFLWILLASIASALCCCCFLFGFVLRKHKNKELYKKNATMIEPSLYSTNSIEPGVATNSAKNEGEPQTELAALPNSTDMIAAVLPVSDDDDDSKDEIYETQPPE